MFASLAAAGMPLMLLVGAAPNAIAFESHQFRTREFFLAGLSRQLILIGVIGSVRLEGVALDGDADGALIVDHQVEIIPSLQGRWPVTSCHRPSRHSGPSALHGLTRIIHEGV